MVKNNKKDIIFYIFIAIATIATMSLPYISNGDELWTFANTYKLYNGVSLYNANNIIVTPLFFWIGNLFFKILGATFFTYKIYNIVLIFLLYIGLYKLLKECKIKQEIAIIVTILIMFADKIINVIGANYTILALIFFIIGVTNLVKNRNDKINLVFQGIIIFLIFLTKQNIAVYYSLALFAYILTKPNKIKNLFILGLSVIIPTAVFLGYELYIGELYNFINYAFLGIGEFAQNNIIVEGYTYTQIEIGFQIVSIILGISQIIENKKKNKKDEILIILLMFGIANIMLGYPIFNLYHVSTGILIPSVLVSYVLYQYAKNIKIDEESKKIIDSIINKVIIALGIVLLILGGIYVLNLNKVLINNKQYSKGHPFYGGIISKDESEYDEVMKFIQDKKQEGYNILIFDIRANFYMVPLGENNKDYDLPMLGNWGKNGEERILEDVKSKTNTYFLTYEETRNITTQESKKIKTYIKENSKNEGKIGKYDIYYKN